MEVLGAHHSVSMPASTPPHADNMATSNPIESATAETSFIQREHQRMISDPNTTSKSHPPKPMWYFLLNRTGQSAAMKQIAMLSNTTPGLAWEEKWAAAEATLRGSRPEQMAGIDEAMLHLRRFIVYDGDSPLPNLFTNCSTEEERLDALLARPSPLARMALDTFSKRTGSRRSINSSSDSHKPIVHVRNLAEGSSGDTEKSSGAMWDARVKDQKSDEMGDDDLSEEDHVMQRLIEGCKS